jgi:hypothetical protein
MIVFHVFILLQTTKAFILPKAPYSSPGTVVVLNAKGFSSQDASITVDDQKRRKSIEHLEQWSKDVGIQSKDIKISSGSPIIGGGLGLLTTNSVPPNSVMLQVPTHLTFSVSNSKIDSNRQSESYFLNKGKAYVDAPWWAKLSIDLFICDQIDSKRSKDGKGDGETIDMRPWLDSLPRSFDTPIRWSKSDLEELQYQPLVSMVAAQENSYKATFNALKDAIDPSSPLVRWSYDNFLWGVDCARSRAFSGAYSGSAFDPKPYALTLVLVVAYIGLHLGTIEQASNGAALVFCASVLRDFVLPKLFKTKRYVICPFIDMANHVGMKEEANVAFEYFANGYSLSSREGKALDKGTEVRISYGPRSNDALLQQYGFVEPDNAHDVYVMPPLREWDIAAMEKACGRKFQSGRLQKLDRAGLLGGSSLGSNDNEDDFVEGIANRGRGVVLTRATGLDPAIMTALRVLVSSDDEWEAVGQAVGNMTTENSAGEENERLAKVAAQVALELELAKKPTTLAEDEERLKNSSSLGLSTNQILALQFRIEKKKLLKESIFALSL